MKDIKVVFGRKVKEVRQKRGITQEQLAELLDLSTVQVSRFECGHHFPSLAHLLKIANACEIEIKDLFDFDTQPSLKVTSSKRKLLKLIDGISSDKIIKLVYGVATKIVNSLNDD